MSDDIQLVGGDPAGSGGGSGRIRVAASVLAEIDDHVGSDTTVEQGGVLVGDVDAATATTVVTARIPAVGAISEVASLRFTHETWDHINTVMERDHPGSRMVGWYHSHPHFGIFLSEYDQFIHNNFFSQPWQVAYVVDPLLRQRGFFAWVEGTLVRVPTWETYRTEAGAAGAPIGTPPPRPPAPSPGPPPPGPPSPGAPAQEPGGDKLSPWSLGLLIALVVALIGAVLVVTKPFAPDEPEFRILVPQDRPLDDTATAGGTTILGRVEVDGAPEQAPLAWSYQPTDGSDTPPDAISVTPIDRSGRFRLSWDSESIDDGGQREGTLIASYCDEAENGGACDGDLQVAELPISLTIEDPPADGFALPSVERYTTGPGIQPFVPDERLILSPVDQPTGVDGVTTISTHTLGDNSAVLFQVRLDESVDPEQVEAELSTLAPHVGLEEPESALDPRPALSDDDRDRLGQSADDPPDGDPVEVTIVDLPGRVQRARTLACGERGVSTHCARRADDAPSVSSAAAGPVSVLEVIEVADAVAPGSVVALTVGLPDDGCPRFAPSHLANLTNIVAETVRAHPETLWVLPSTDCSKGLVDALEGEGNVVTVNEINDGVEAELELEKLQNAPENPADTTADLVAIVTGAAAEVWSVNRELGPDDVRTCLEDQVDDGQLRIAASRELCRPDEVGDDTTATPDAESSPGSIGTPQQPQSRTDRRGGGR